MKHLLIPLLLTLFCATPVGAAPSSDALMTGRALSLMCSSSKTEDLFACQNYIAGIVDYHHLIKGLGTAPSVDFCPPAGTTMEQMRQVVTAYLRRHSEHQDFIAAPGVAMSLYSAWPCKRRK